jgi:hypothetical protein
MSSFYGATRDTFVEVTLRLLPIFESNDAAEQTAATSGVTGF